MSKDHQDRRKHPKHAKHADPSDAPELPVFGPPTLREHVLTHGERIVPWGYDLEAGIYQLEDAVLVVPPTDDGAITRHPDLTSVLDAQGTIVLRSGNDRAYRWNGSIVTTTDGELDTAADETRWLWEECDRVFTLISPGMATSVWAVVRWREHYLWVDDDEMNPDPLAAPHASWWEAWEAWAEHYVICRGSEVYTPGLTEAEFFELFTVDFMVPARITLNGRTVQLKPEGWDETPEEDRNSLTEDEIDARWARSLNAVPLAMPSLSLRPPRSPRTDGRNYTSKED